MDGAVGDVAEIRARVGGRASETQRQHRGAAEAPGGMIAQVLVDSTEANRHLVRAAARHLSHVHEDPDSDVAPSMLKVLAAVGAAFLGQTAALHCYRHADSTAEGGISVRVGNLMVAFGAWALDVSGVRDHGRLGAGQPMQESVARDLALQVLGALCLEGRQDAAGRICEDFVRSADLDRAGVPDPVSQLPPTVVVAATRQSGPDHEACFTVVLGDGRGRSAEGSGRSKKAARSAASSAWLAAHGSSSAPDRVAGRRAPVAAPRELIQGSRHRAGVARIRDMFSVPPAGEVLIGQALIHPSWSYENHTQIGRAGQRDLRALAAAGSWVLAYEFAILRARAVDPRVGTEAGMSVPSREATARVARQLLLIEGLLLGRGQRSTPLSDAGQEDVLQAVVAAAVLTRGVAAPLLDSLHHRWRSAFVNSAVAEVDHIRAMERCCSSLRLSASYAAERTGPDHESSFRARVTIESDLGGAAFTVTTAEEGRTVVAARQAVTRRAMAAIDAAAAEGSLKPNSTASVGKLITFIRRHLAALRSSASTRGAATLREALDQAAAGQSFCHSAGDGSRIQLADETTAAVFGDSELDLPAPRVGGAQNGSAQDRSAPPSVLPPATSPETVVDAEPRPAPSDGDPSVLGLTSVPSTSAALAPVERSDDGASEGQHSPSVDANAYQTFLTVNADGDLIGRVREQFGDWLRKQKSWDPPTHENGFQRGPEGKELLVLHRSSADGHDFRARLREQHATTGTWTTNLTVHVGSAGERAWIGLRVSNSDGRFVQVPRLASFLVDALEARDGDTWLSSAPRLVSVADVEAFAEELSSVERQGLYFVAGTGRGDEPIEGFRDLVADWTRSTIGLAQVAILDPAATDAFAEIMGTHHRVPAWTVRTFKPEVDPAIEEDGRRHRILGTHRLASEPKLAVRALLTRVARRHTAERPRPRRFVAVDQALTRLEDRLLVEELGGNATAPTPPMEPAPSAAAPSTPGDVPPSPAATEPTDNVEAEASSTEQVSTQAEQYLAQIELTKAVLGVDELSPEALDELARQAAQGRRNAAATDRLTRELDERRQRAEVLTDEVAHYRELSDDYEVHLDQAATDLARSADENRWLRSRLRELEDYDTASSAVPESQVTDYPDGFAELADRIARGAVPNVAFTGNIKVVRALDEHDPLGRIARVAWDALLALSDYVRARTAGECERGIKHYLENTPDGFRRTPPNKFAESESAATMSAFGAERVFPVPAGVTTSGHATMAPHFKLGKVGMVSPRLHLLDDWSRSGAVYVGYIGPHLRIAQTN